MVIDSTVLGNQSNPFDFIGRTASFLFSSEKKEVIRYKKAIDEADTVVELLINFLEEIDSLEEAIDEDNVDKLLKAFSLGSEMGEPLLSSLKSSVRENSHHNDSLFHKTKTLYFKTKEIIETLNKIIYKLQDIKEDRLSTKVSDLSKHTLNNLWSESEEDELKKLFLES